MTVPPPPPVDPGNQLLAETPAQITTTLVDTPAGQRLALTLRTTSATVTVLLAGADAKAWSAQFAKAAAGMSASGLVVAGTAIPQ